MSGEERITKGQMIWLASAWLLVGIVIYLSLARLDEISMPEGGDKFEHLLAYAALSYWFMQVYAKRTSRVAIALALIALGVTLEFLQGYTGYRHFDYADMIANAAGVVLGWIGSPPRTPSVLSRVERYISR